MADMDKVIGIVLIVVGALALLDWLDLGWIITVAAIAAIVVGILILVGTLHGSTAMGVVTLVLGLLLLVPNWLTGALRGVLATLLAIALVVLGVLKLLDKW